MKETNLEVFENEEWYDALVEECRDIVTETVFNSQMDLIEGKHKIGERICTDPHFKKMKGSKNATLKSIFKDIGIGKTDGYFCVAFYEKYPKLSTGLDSFKDQKNISWNKIKAYLPKQKENGAVVDMSRCKHEDYYIIKVCRACGRKEQIKKQDESKE